MKRFLLLFMIILFSNFSSAQNNNYESLWKKVENFEIEGLPKSALKIVEDIEVKAKKEENAPQLIKIMLFKSKFALVLEEEAQLKIINNFKTEIEKSKFPVKNVLENILANLYWQYFQQNRWKFYNRTKVFEVLEDTDNQNSGISRASMLNKDFRTWDLQTLFNEIHLHYQNSLQNGLLLQLEPLKNYDALLKTQKNSKLYRPTLFDFLSHNALEFYKTNETHITKPSYKFEIDNPDYLSNANTFSSLNITSKDATSLQLNALKIYKELIRFHLKDEKQEALAFVNIERLKFVNQYATFKNKQDILLKALQTESKKYKNNDVSALYDFEIASIYFQQSQKYNPNTSEKHQWKAKEALDICNNVLTKFPKSIGAQKCQVLKQQIKHPTLNITAESYIPTHQYSRLLVRYKNLDTLQFKAYKLNENQFEKYGSIYNQDEKRDFLNKLKATKTWKENLLNENDYQTHSIEVLVPKLDNGRYIILATNEEESKNFYGLADLQVTNLAVVESENDIYKIFQIVNRNNGLPIADAHVEWSYYSRGNRSKKTKNFTSDNLGQIKIKKTKEYRSNTQLEVSSSNDLGYFGNYWISNYYSQDKDDTTYKAFIFTDRSIYRPGQTVYFKAIAMKTKDGKSEVLANESVYAVLYNSNNEKVKELNLKTNEFGSVNGEFILPNTGLNGEYFIAFNGNNKYLNALHYFSVEEYKRPKFETKFKPITETFKINDSITVKGNAVAFAGSNITDAKVVYRVHRKVQYPRWYYWYRSSSFNSEPQEITHGESSTNDKGEFEITFKALPDKSVDKSSLPIFKYEIIADVTDINGETRSAATIVNVGYHTLTANLNIDAKLDKTKKDHSITISTKNLNGEFVPATGIVKIYKLKAPDNVLRSRPWAAPDYKWFTKENFKSLFPHDAYTDEHEPKNWKKGDLVFEKAFNTKDSKTLKLGKIKKWLSGQYITILESKDKFGQEVKDETKITLFSDKDASLADKQLFSITPNKATYNTGEIAQITLASAAENMFVTVTIEKNREIIDTKVIQLNNNKKVMSIPVTNEDLGGFAVHYSLATFNSSKTGTLNISVPYPKTDLDITTKTFRDRLQPGTEETWSFNIKGPKGDKVSAELLASMYDASLDQFKEHYWNFNPINNPIYYASYRSNANQSFGSVGFRIQNKNSNRLNYPNQYFDTWNWFGFSVSNDTWTYNRYLRYLKAKRTPDKAEYDKTIKKGFVTGKVLDNEFKGEPLAYANIVVLGTGNGVTTDKNGNFTIQASKNQELEISFVGYGTKIIKIDNNNKFVISLSSDASSLQSIVIRSSANRLPETSLLLEQKKEVSLNAEIAENDATSVYFKKEANYTTAEDLENPEYHIGLDKAGIVTNKKISTGTANIHLLNVSKNKALDLSNIKIRKNLKETAFFFPNLKTDENGNVSFSFTTPEALTQWKLQLLAHTKNLESATKTLTTVTQKELMVIPNTPRFLREGDKITISTKISNLTEKELSGQALLVLTDAISGKDITNTLVSKAFEDTNKTKQVNMASKTSATELFTIAAKSNTQVSWNLSIPDDVQAVQYKVIAKTEDFSDGEQNALPVLSNRMLVTETLPMWIKSNETKTFTLDKLASLNESTRASGSTIKHHKLTLEMTSNPAWYAVQALPYLMEYPHECNEQTFSRFYANALANHIANSNPRIQEVFNQWASQDALLSNLEKNEELKSILIQETPWLRDAQSETEQKKRIALLFDLNKMNNELQSALNKLKNNQMSSGAWPWFKGGRENRWITQHIITGFGHLKHLSVIQSDSEESQMIKKAIKYLDAAFIKEYKNLKKYNKEVDLSKDHLSFTQLHYLYMRSFFPEIKKSKEVETISKYYQTQIKKYWLKRSLYAKGLMTLIMYRDGDLKTAGKILKSLEENSITSEELGMYWKANTNSWFWYQAPIETQALLIEAFSEAGNSLHITLSAVEAQKKNLETIDNLKIWLLKNKQTNRWKTTKATTEAVYALLLQGSDWLSVTDMVDVALGGQKIEPSKLEDVKIEAGTGYFKTSWNSSDIKPNMGEVKLTKKGNGIAWGGLYWQYFEDLDKITSAETPLKLKKKLFLKKNTDTGEEITEITTQTNLKVGDLVRVRIELRSDRPMEFVHMKDMRASGLEPLNVLSKYKWQDGLGYYESTKDASTNFFFDYLPKGVYVFEYDLRVNNAGNMSNGITTIQSMYAPEFSSHSEGIRVTVK